MSFTHQYIFNNKIITVQSILFKNLIPIANVDKITFFKELNLSGDWLTKQFRYSFDDATWSNWTTLSSQALQNITFNNFPEFYIEIKYTRENYNTAAIDEFYLFYESLDATPVDEPAGIINADLLQGQPGSYYLDRANFSGGYTDLTVKNTSPELGTDEPPGVYAGRVDSSEGTTLLFKRIDSSNNNVIITQDANRIYINIDSSFGTTPVYKTNLPDSLETPNAVGGISAGTTVADLKDKLLSELWDTLLFPTIYPTYVNPSSTFIDYSNTYQEVGDIINISYTSTFNRGQILLNGVEQDTRSGQPTSYKYSDPSANTLLIDASVNVNTYSQSITNYKVLFGNQYWYSRILYDEGPQPIDSEGADYGSPLPAGVTSDKSVSITGVYAIFATTVDISYTTKQSLISMSSSVSGEYTVVSESGGFKQSFEIPEKWTGVPTFNYFTAVETYDTNSESWKLQGGTSGSSLGFWDETNIVKTIFGVTENYKKYTYNGVDRGPIKIRLIF